MRGLQLELLALPFRQSILARRHIGEIARGAVDILIERPSVELSSRPRRKLASSEYWPMAHHAVVVSHAV